MGKRLAQALVGFLEIDIFPDKGDGNVSGRMFGFPNNRFPLSEVVVRDRELERFDDPIVDPSSCSISGTS